MKGREENAGSRTILIAHNLENDLDTMFVGVFRQDSLAGPGNDLCTDGVVLEIKTHQIPDFGLIVEADDFLAGLEKVLDLPAVIGEQKLPAGRNIKDPLVDRAFHLQTRAIEIDGRAGVELRS